MQQRFVLLALIPLALAVIPLRAAKADDLSIIVIPQFADAPSYHGYQAYVGNRSGSAINIDGIHIVRVSGSDLMNRSTLYPSNFGSGWEIAPTSSGYAAYAGMLNWSSQYSVAAGSSRMLSTSTNLFASSGYSAKAPAAGEWQVGFRADSSVSYTGQVCAALAGDANLDGIVNSADGSICSTYAYQEVSGGPSEPTWTKCDFTGDGYVNSSDFGPVSLNNGKACSNSGSYE